MDVKAEFPVSVELAQKRLEQIEATAAIFEGRSDKLLLVIGPCSADSEAPVLDYIYRLAGVQEKVKDKILIIPRVYTGKPRTTGEGYKGMLHQPNRPICIRVSLR